MNHNINNNNNQKGNKTLWQRIKYGIQKGREDEFLPDHILAFQKTREFLIFNSLGLLSMPLFLSGILKPYHIIYWGVFFYSLVYIGYRWYISYLWIKGFFIKLFKGELTIRN